jgi:hypothetical protein
VFIASSRPSTSSTGSRRAYLENADAGKFHGRCLALIWGGIASFIPDRVTPARDAGDVSGQADEGGGVPFILSIAGWLQTSLWSHLRVLLVRNVDPGEPVAFSFSRDGALPASA